MNHKMIDRALAYSIAHAKQMCDFATKESISELEKMVAELGETTLNEIRGIASKKKAERDKCIARSEGIEIGRKHCQEILKCRIAELKAEKQ